MVKSRLNTKALSLNIETLRELTPDEAAGINGGFKASSAMPPAHGGFAQPTATAVSSARPPVHHRKHHQTVSSVRPI